MRKKCIALVSIILLICMFGTCTMSMAAQTSKDVEKQKKEAEQKNETVKAELNSAMQQVEDISSSITKAEEDVKTITDDLKTINGTIEAKQKDLNGKQKLLEERLVASYMNSDNTYMDALFSGGVTNFISNYDQIKQIAEYDNKLISEVKETKKTLEEQKTKKEDLKVEKEEKSKELKKLKAEKEKTVSSLTEEQKKIQAQVDEYDNQMKEIARKEKEAEEAAKHKPTASASNKVYVTGTGEFTWPVPASHNISSNYGYRIHPIYKTRKLHAGIDIAAPGGADIVAADSGKVELASNGYNGGYGNYIVVNHGNGKFTRYAHCSKLYASVGQTVSKGQVIAAVGSTGSSTGNHCHFEVRINGSSTNPLGYL